MFVVEPRPLRLVFRCKPLVAEGLPAQRAAVFVNGERVGERTITPGWNEYDIDTPASVWREGRNRLRFEYAWSRSPAESGGAEDDQRPLAVSWDRLRLGDTRSESGPRPFAEGGALVVPLSSQVDYYLEVPAGGRLVVDRPESWAASGSPALHRTEVVIRAQGGAERTDVHRLDNHGARVSLRDFEGRTVRISFRAVPERGWLARALATIGWTASPRESGVALPRPVIRADEPLAPGAPGEGPVIRRPRSRPNVLVYLIDTLRADHLGCYGYDRPVSPHIDRFAADAVRFERTFAQSSWTRSSVVSLLTGLHPQIHRVTGRNHSLPGEARTLAELLSGLGYETAAVVTNPNVTPGYGFDQGFDEFGVLSQTSSREILRLSDDVNEVAFRWLDDRDDDGRPFFLYLHTTDPHAPYTPREPWRSRFASGAPPELGEIDSVKRITAARLPLSGEDRQALIDLYDAEIAFNDAMFGALLDGLRERGLYDSTLIILVSDHGEEFLDHGGWQHGVTLYEEQLHVPFLLRLPKGELAGRTVDTLAQLVDVTPTVLDSLGELPPEDIDGRSLLPALEGVGEERTGIAHLDLDGHRLEAVRSGDRKLVRWLPARQHSRVELFDLSRDPAEQRDLSISRPIEAGVLQSRLNGLGKSRGTMEAREIDVPPEVEERLRALGYLQ